MIDQHRNIILIVLTLGVLSVGLALLAGCAPQHLATRLPPATVLAPDPSPNMPAPVSPTAPPVANTAMPAPQMSATPMPPKSPTVVTAAGPMISITILHTNDVMGEIDPCG